MLSQAQIEAHRNMTVEERWEEVEALMTLAWRMLQELPHEEIERRLARDREEHDRADAIIVAHWGDLLELAAHPASLAGNGCESSTTLDMQERGFAD